MDTALWATQQKKAWTILRWKNAKPTCDILKYTITGKDAASGQKGTRSLVAGNSGISVLITDFSVEQMAIENLKIMDGDKLFVFYDLNDAQQPRIEEQLLYPSGTTKKWTVLSVWTLGNRTEVHARLDLR